MAGRLPPFLLASGLDAVNVPNNSQIYAKIKISIIQIG
jgi:hypothetical protein